MTSAGGCSINVKGKVTLREKTGHIATHARQAWIGAHVDADAG
jgi:hypothetical protein